MTNTDLLLIGFGNVGRAFARLLLDKRQSLRQKFHLEWRVVGISTHRHGGALDPQGLDLDQAVSVVENGGQLDQLSIHSPPTDTLQLIRSVDAHVMFENTPVNYQTGQPAVDHIRASLERGMHAITANKGPVVHAYQELTSLARSRGRCFYFESTVMDGAPIFSLFREALPAAELHSFRGVLNSTTNLILSLMEEGQSFEQAIAHAQSVGIAESDPSGDTMGWDAAVKVAALVTVLMNTPLKPDQVDRQGIEDLTLADVQEARSQGRRWKLVCTAERTHGEVRGRVRPELVDPNDPLHNIMGTSSAVTLDTDVLGALTVAEANPGPHTTAYGLLADFLSAVLGIREKP